MPDQIYSVIELSKNIATKVTRYKVKYNPLKFGKELTNTAVRERSKDNAINLARIFACTNLKQEDSSMYEDTRNMVASEISRIALSLVDKTM